ncbi:MAG: phospholipid carrier-dependent glycosyltransferase [Patescibacteria group bacterium]
MIPVLLFAVSVITHFIFFGHPSAVVFDEVHLGTFISAYWHGSYFFDVHPPLGKLIFALFGYLFGAQNSVTDFTVIGNALPASITALRILPILAGTALPLIIYALCRRFNFSKTASMVAGLFIALENSLIVQSRFILLDSFILFFGFLSLLLYLEFVRRRTGNIPYSKIFLTFSVLFSAVAFNIKWTGLSFLALIVLMELYRQYGTLSKKVLVNIFTTIRKTLPLACLYIGATLFIYFGIFAIHFALLPHTGTGDAFMTPSFQKTLIDSRYATDSSLPSENIVIKFLELNARMFIANQSLTAPASYSSNWYTWPFMKQPIFYWQESNSLDTASPNSYIYLLGNPFIYWLGTLTVILLIIKCIWLFLAKNRSIVSFGNSSHKFALFFILTGYLANLLPFIFIGRVMFLYHYETALVFSIIGIALLLDIIPLSRKRAIAITIIGLATLAFVFFSPLTYGTPLSDSGLTNRMWFFSWR